MPKHEAVRVLLSVLSGLIKTGDKSISHCVVTHTVSLNSMHTMDCRLSQCLEKLHQRLFIVFYPNPHYDMYRTVRWYNYTALDPDWEQDRNGTCTRRSN